MQHVTHYEKALKHLYRKAVSSEDISIEIIRSNVRRVSNLSEINFVTFIDYLFRNNDWKPKYLFNYCTTVKIFRHPNTLETIQLLSETFCDIINRLENISVSSLS